LQQKLDEQMAHGGFTHSSVSHCPLASGFALSHQRIGFDIEDQRRLHAVVIERVSTPEEVQACPLLPGLWVAIESAFKAPLKVISELRIFDWKVEPQQLKFQVYFKGSNLCPGDGIVRFQGHLILGIYLNPY
jgi:hypothetical protein